MAKKKREKRVQTESRRRPPGKCFFCEGKARPDYKDWQTLQKFISDRKKISSRLRSGVCAKHQKLLAREVKRARYLALLPFSVKI